MTKGFGGKKPNTNMSNNIDYLKSQLDRAVESQDFEKAVELRDRISKLKDVEGKVKELEVELSKAIKEQKFERCIEIRDEIKNLRK
jgi:protein-arginine kinase activator protein McsA